MKSTIKKISLVLLVASSIAFAQSDEEAIRKVLVDQVEAWNKGDIDSYMKGYWDSEETVFLSGGNITRGYQEVLARYKKTYATREMIGMLEFEDLKVRMLGSNDALVSGIWRLTRKSDRPWGRFTLIVERKKEGWRITHDHTSSAQ